MTNAVQARSVARKRAAHGGVSLVCMPWQGLRAPSIQLGTLQALLDRAGMPCRSHSLHVEFAAFATAPRGAHLGLLTLADYQEIGDRWFLSAPGEWVFAAPPVKARDAAEDRHYLARLRRDGMSSRTIKRLQALRPHIPGFLARCADEVLAAEPVVVGFTTTFGQTVASLMLAAELKRRAPSLNVVFGGAGCEGSMGEALMAAYDWVDVVVFGEAEPVLVELVAALVDGQRPGALPGCLIRDGGASAPAASKPRPSAVVMDTVPMPDYREFFDRMAANGFLTEISPSLPYETSRGCWWGQRSHCTFCGLNGATMAHRSKSARRVIDDLTSLAARHGVLDFTLVDNILDREYFESLLPALASRQLDLRVFCQTKSNLQRAQLRRLHDAGVRYVRPGVESLSTPILKLMRKGVSALHNVRTLKWCAEYGIHAAWNVIYGIPGEPIAEYERMARLFPSLFHLAAPSLAPLTLDRFSPYHDDPERHGLELHGAPAHYRALYDLPPAMAEQLAWRFEFGYHDGRQPEHYIGALREQLERWRVESHANRHALTYRRGPGFIRIDDHRTTAGRRCFTLDSFETAVYLGCDGGASPARLERELRRDHPSVTADRLRCLLDEMVAEQLAYEEDGVYLSLAIAAEAPAPEPAAAAAAAGANAPSILASAPLRQGSSPASATDRRCPS